MVFKYQNLVLIFKTFLILILKIYSFKQETLKFQFTIFSQLANLNQSMFHLYNIIIYSKNNCNRLMLTCIFIQHFRSYNNFEIFLVVYFYVKAFKQ